MPRDVAAYSPVAGRAELDRWILSELDRTILEVRGAMDRYETYPAARAISAFVDALSNWYVRRSRARFWAGDWTQDKADAYWTLYECLLKLARLAAPFTPFFCEVTWRNLTKPLPGAAESVHLTTYPTAAAASIDQKLLDDMAVTREAVNLGLSARRSANLKVRQPLGLCELVLTEEAMKEGLSRHLDLITEELNIKRIEFTEKPEGYVTYEVKPNFKLLGPKFGKKVKTIGKALAEGDGAALYAQIQDGAIRLEIEGEPVELAGEDVDVRLTPKAGFAAAQGKNMVVVISTEITEELKREGWVREFIRIVQDMRKEQGLAYDARIEVSVHIPDAALAATVEEYRDTIAHEVLADAIVFAKQPDGNAKEAKIDDAELAVQVVAK